MFNSKKFIRYENGKAVIRAELIFDTPSELPASVEYEGYILSQGSVAWTVKAKEVYALASDGNWVKQ